MRLYFIGMLMGICDLIPGVSGGTVAYASGIYDEFLAAIRSLNLTHWKKVHWSFLLRLFAGVVTSVLLFSKLFYFLLTHYQLLLFAFFFGAILASAVSSLRKPSGMLAVGFVFSFIICSLPHTELLQISSFWLAICGMLSACAMLLPGISGSFMLHILGVYLLFIKAIAQLDIKFLVSIGLGISSGLILFSRIVSRLLARYPDKMHAFLMGCVIGGLRSLWPYNADNVLFATLFLLLGFTMTFFLERKVPLLLK